MCIARTQRINKTFVEIAASGGYNYISVGYRTRERVLNKSFSQRESIGFGICWGISRT